MYICVLTKNVISVTVVGGHSLINEEEKLKRYIREHNIAAEHLRFEKTLHTVDDTVRVTGFDIDLITKSMIFKDDTARTIVGMVPARFRVSASRLGRILNCAPPTLVSPSEAYERTGYPAGGMPCFGYDAIIVIDPFVTRKQFVYTGGGSEFSLVKISADEIVRITKPRVGGRIRGNKSD